MNKFNFEAVGYYSESSPLHLNSIAKMKEVDEIADLVAHMANDRVNVLALDRKTEFNSYTKKSRKIYTVTMEFQYTPIVLGKDGKPLERVTPAWRKFSYTWDELGHFSDLAVIAYGYAIALKARQELENWGSPYEQVALGE